MPQSTTTREVRAPPAEGSRDRVAPVAPHFDAAEATALEPETGVKLAEPDGPFL